MVNPDEVKYVQPGNTQKEAYIIMGKTSNFQCLSINLSWMHLHKI